MIVGLVCISESQVRKCQRQDANNSLQLKKRKARRQRCDSEVEMGKR